MSVTCPACRTSGLPAQSRFCLSCGSALPVTADEELRAYTPEHLTREVLTSRRAREGERKEVTVLFADVEGSLAMAEELDPEDVHAIMDGFFELALNAIHAEGGTINQFRGDGFMALFGAPHARNEAAVGALQAALTIRDEVRAYSRSVESRLGIPLHLRLGLHTGPVWVGSIGSDLRSDYTAEGRTVGLAARMERAARSGQILVSGDTARRVRDRFVMRDLGAHEFRGISEPTAVFELLARGPYSARFEVERARGLAPFVGREAELASVPHPAADPERARLLEVVGEAGVGKSRFVLEYLERTGASVFETDCRESDATRAYAPWLALLRAWPGDFPGAEEAAALARDFGGAPGAVSGTRQDFERRLGDLLGGLKIPTGAVVLLENVHWIDPSSQRILDGLIASRLPGPLLFVTTARSDLARPSSTPLHRIELGPLHPAESRALASSLLANLSDAEALIELSVSRGNGNPLFVEETARNLRESPEDVRHAARAEMSLQRDPFRVPETVNGVIASRIDALPDGAKRLLQAASVVTVPFERALLAEIEPEATGELEPLLDELIGRRLLVERDDRLDFSHVLLREVAYSEILHSRLAPLHGRAAEALVARGLDRTPDGASRIGTHYDRAGNATLAAEQLAVAGRAYLRLHAHTEAAAHLRRSWELASELPASARVALGLSLVSALNALDRASEAADVLNALNRETHEEADQRKLALAFIEEGWVRFSGANDVVEGRSLIDRGLRLGAGLAQGLRVEAAGQGYLARLLMLDGDVDAALTSAERLIELGTELGDEFLRTLGLCTRGGVGCERGNIAQALADCRAAVAAANASQNPVSAGLAEVYLSHALALSGEPEAALEAARRAEELGERSGQLGVIHNARGYAGEAQLLLGEPSAARRSFEAMAEHNDRWPGTLLRRARGEVALRRYHQAAEIAQDCLAQKPPRLLRARALCALGAALGLAEPDDLSAEGPLRESIDLCKRLGLRPHLAEAHAALAVVLNGRDEKDAARAHRQAAVRVYAACGMPLHERQAAAGLLFGSTHE